MTRISFLAAAGALLLSTASVTSAETFDVRGQLLHNKFGDLSSHIARRQDDSQFDSSSSLDDIASSLTTSGAGSIITTVATVSGLSQWTTAFVPSRTASSASSGTSSDSASSTGTASSPSSTAWWSGPSELYIIDMCMPNLFDVARAERLGITLKVTSQSQAYLEAAKLAISLGGSPFPCEQSIYIEYACHANATTPVDFLAEQQCYCDSTFFAADQACNSCFLAHGLVGPSETEYGDRMESFSTKVCDATPAAGGIAAAAKTGLPPQMTLGGGAAGLNFAPKSAVQHPSSTAVSLYADLPSLSIPTMTGEATARATNWGNWNVNVRNGNEATSAASEYAAPAVSFILGAVALGAALVL